MKRRNWLLLASMLVNIILATGFYRSHLAKLELEEDLGRQAAMYQVNEIRGACEAYYVDHGDWPSPEYDCSTSLKSLADLLRDHRQCPYAPLHFAVDTASWNFMHPFGSLRGAPIEEPENNFSSFEYLYIPDPRPSYYRIRVTVGKRSKSVIEADPHQSAHLVIG
jgi:hypothetical protein